MAVPALFAFGLMVILNIDVNIAVTYPPRSVFALLEDKPVTVPSAVSSVMMCLYSYCSILCAYCDTDLIKSALQRP